jgi:hypothetical protein
MSPIPKHILKPGKSKTSNIIARAFCLPGLKIASGRSAVCKTIAVTSPQPSKSNHRVRERRREAAPPGDELNASQEPRIELYYHFYHNYP